MRIKFVKVAGVLFVGTEVEGSHSLDKPRMVFANSETQHISLSRCIGDPPSLEIHVAPDFTYINNDAEFEKFYQEQIKEPSLIHVVK